MPPRMSNEARFKSLEEKGQSALEMAKEEDATPKASPEDAKQIVQAAPSLYGSMG